jgi:hypothetical protein
MRNNVNDTGGADEHMTIITICGSMRFYQDMLRLALHLELCGNVCLTPTMPPEGNDSLTKVELATLGHMHKEKIRISDTVLICDVGGYIGDSTRSEIEFAQALGKDVLYYSQMSENESKDICSAG